MIANTLLCAVVIAATYTGATVSGFPIDGNEGQHSPTLTVPANQLESEQGHLPTLTVEDAGLEGESDPLQTQESQKSVALADSKAKAEASPSGIPGFSSIPGIDSVTGMGQATQSESGRPQMYIGSFQMMTMPMPTAAEMAAMLQQIGPVMQQLQGLGAAGAAGGAPAAG